MTLYDDLAQSGVVAAIAGISSLMAIAATQNGLPCVTDLYTTGLATALAFFVRFATLKEYEPRE